MQEPSISPSTVRRAALYIRTGTVPEIAETDVEPLQAYAAQRGYQLAETYRDEGVSGKQLDRPALNRLLADAASHRFDVVLVSHQSSFASTPVDAHAIVEKIQQTGVAIESLADDIVTPEDDRPALDAAPPRRAEAVDRKQLHEGMTVLGANGAAIGKLKQLRDDDMWVDRTMQRDIYVPLTAIQAVADNSVVLNVGSGKIGNMGWERPPLTGR